MARWGAWGVVVPGRLAGATLAVREGVTVLVGPSGAGKTSLLRVLAGELGVSAGRVLRPVRIGAAWQDPYLHFHRPTVAEEVEALVGLSAAEELLGILGIPGDVSPFSLSYGQARLLSVIMAFAWGRDGVVLDEPAAGLDGPGKLLVVGLARSSPAPVVAATHDLELAIVLADRLAVVDGGRVLWAGDPLEGVELLETRLGYRPLPPLLSRGRVEAARAVECLRREAARYTRRLVSILWR